MSRREICCAFITAYFSLKCPMLKAQCAASNDQCPMLRKIEIPNPKSSTSITSHRDTETQRKIFVLCASESLRPVVLDFKWRTPMKVRDRWLAHVAIGVVLMS